MSFDLGHIWVQMSIVNKGVIVLLILMSIYSLTVAIERLIFFSKARKQSLAFARGVTGFLKNDNLQGAIDSSKKFTHSHVARVVAAGLLEFKNDADAGGGGVVGHDMIEAAERAIEREALLVSADFKRGLAGLATIGSIAVFIGLFGTVIGIIRAFQGMAATSSAGLGTVSAAIAEALIATATGLIVAIFAVWIFNVFLNKIERFQIEMTNATSELIDYFIKRRAAGVTLRAS